MGPKLNKKEKAAFKKLEKSQFAEIDRRLEQERLQKEAEEDARLKLEAKITFEKKQAWLKAEHERLQVETDSISIFMNMRDSSLAKIEVVDLAILDWNLYLDTSGLPHASKESSINGYLETMYASLDMDCNSILQTLLDINKVVYQAEELALGEDQKGNIEMATKYRGYMQKLEQMGNTRLDSTTSYLLQFSYDLWKEKQETLVCGKVEDWKLALWINHVKNPRFRVLELPTLDMIVTLPKQFALANVAVRLLHQTVIPLYHSRNCYMPLGGVFVIDVLGLPPQAKIVKTWTLENIASGGALINLGYPIPVVGQAIPSAAALANVTPFGVEILIPSFIIHWNPTPEVGWWDEKEQVWQIEGITDIVYENEAHKLSFQTTKAKPHAVIQNRVKQMPFTSWVIRPTSSCTALLTLKTPMLDILLNIGDGWCQLLEPQIAECKDIQAQKLPPKVLLQQLMRRGLNLLPEDEDKSLLNVSIKDAALEKYICQDMALAIPAFTLASSSLNAKAAKDICVMRIQEIPEPLYPPTFEKSKVVKTLVYRLKGNALLDHSDKLPDYPDLFTKLLDDELAIYHVSILVTLRGVCTESSQEKMESGNFAFMECVNNLAYALRLFSFGP
ncbi:unnamed protein product [Sphagnum tenellum]